MRALWCVHTINVMLNNMSLFVSNSYIEFVNSIQALGLELASSRWAKKIRAPRQKQHLGMYIYMTWWPHNYKQFSWVRSSMYRSITFAFYMG